MALGFVVPTTIVIDRMDPAEFHLIGEDLFSMFVGVGVFTTLLSAVVVFGKYDT